MGEISDAARRSGLAGPLARLNLIYALGQLDVTHTRSGSRFGFRPCPACFPSDLAGRSEREGTMPGAKCGCVREARWEMKAKPGMILRADGQRNGSRVSGFVCHSAGTPDGWTATVDRLPGLSLMKRMAGDALGVILYRPYFRRSSA